MEPNLNKFLHVLVREVLSRSDGTYTIEARRRDHRHLAALRDLGYVAWFELTDSAFRAFFATFETIECPDSVQKWVNDLDARVAWKRATGLILRQLGEDYGVTRGEYVFIRDGANLHTWFHELGHVVFDRISPDHIVMLESEVKRHYRVRSAQELEGGTAHPVTNMQCRPAEGIYLTMNGRHHGLDHSGKDAITDEMWAIMFETYCSGLDLKEGVRAMVEDIISSLSALLR